MAKNNQPKIRENTILKNCQFSIDILIIISCYRYMYAPDNIRRVLAEGERQQHSKMDSQQCRVKRAIEKQIFTDKLPIDRPLVHKHAAKVKCTHQIPG